MIERVELERFGPIRHLNWPDLGRINVVIGENGSGKTFLLKAIYAAVRTLEEAGRGQNPLTREQVLFNKIYWTFQAPKIGDLVSRGGQGALSFSMWLGGKRFHYTFGKDTARSISQVESDEAATRTQNSIFLPAKEVLSLIEVILESREQDQVFGFDDTYLDLARALGLRRTQGKNYKEFAQSRDDLEAMIGGRVEFDESRKRWVFRQGNAWFGIDVTAEGIKKIAILDVLLGNRYLSPGSIVFIDEPEAALHPSAIVRLLDIVAMLAKRKIQFFISTHSYFVIKKLFLIAREQELSMPIAAHEGGEWALSDLKDGMPSNAIIDESIRLYEQEVELALG